MNEPVDKYDILLVMIMITIFAINITISVILTYKAIIKKLDAIERKIQLNEVVLPEVSGEKDGRTQEFVEHNYQEVDF